MRSGALLWKFRTAPRPGEFGNESWLNDSWSYSGDVSVWGQLSADEQLGVYAPIETPNNNYYGGARPGNNLFAESLLCLDAKTGRRVWHFQAVHHGLWDWDFNPPPARARFREAMSQASSARRRSRFRPRLETPAAAGSDVA